METAAWRAPYDFLMGRFLMSHGGGAVLVDQGAGFETFQ
jgi:hypothetical protein